MDKSQQIIPINKQGSFSKIAIGSGLLALMVAGLSGLSNPGQFYHSYLTAFIFWLSIGLGALFFTMINHITGSVWSVVIRRLHESIMVLLPVFILLFIPIIFGIGDLFHWSHVETVQKSEILIKKSSYLNIPFFLIRSVIYLGAWTLLAIVLYRLSIKQDRGDERILHRLQRISAPGIFVFAVTLTFAAFDWIMSLDAHWYSTIFGVYCFSGSFLAALVFLVILIRYIQYRGFLNDEITVEHYHDLGKLIFGFVVFWAYIAGSQYFLIWYGNIPEETIWFLHRWEGSWKTISTVIIFGHFVIPFFMLSFRSVKRNRSLLTFFAAWILVMHYIDMYWLIMPSLHDHNAHFSWIDVTAVIGIGGIICGLLWQRLGSASLVPVNDPNLTQSMAIDHG
jgi:hypothetical protein